MITIILLAVLFVGELVFAAWNVKMQIRHDREKMIWRLGLAAALEILLLCGVLEGVARYGMLIVLLLLQGVLLFFRWRAENRRMKRWRNGQSAETGERDEKELPEKSLTIPRQFLRVSGTMLLFLIALFPAILAPQFKPLPVTGEHKVSSTIYTWVDENRLETYSDTGENRTVTLEIWYPEDEGIYPLIVFSHGAGGVLESNASTCVNLASNGYVVAAIAHPYQAAFVKDVNGKITTVDPEFMSGVMTDNGSDDPAHEVKVYEMQKEWLAVRTGDINFVLDTILSRTEEQDEAPFDRIDPEKIGLFGHSLGGAAVVAVGRQREDISAVIDLEGTMLGEYQGYADGKHTYCEEPYPLPLLDVNSRQVYELAKSYTKEPYVNFYMGDHAEDFREIVVEDAGHMNFCDLAVASPLGARLLGTGKTNAWKCLANINELVLNYYNYYLKDASTFEVPDGMEME
mgnify:CR=1 FL=1